MNDDIRLIIADALFNNNFKVNYAGDLSKFLKEINKLKLAKEFNCILCSLIILIVDNELITNIKGE